MVTEENLGRVEPNVGQHEAPRGPRHGKAPRHRRRSSRVGGIITIIIILALVAAIAFAVWYFLFRKSEDLGDVMTEFAQINTIQSKVEGEGNSRAGASAAVTLPNPCTILDVLVNVDDMVFEGQQLFSTHSPTAEKNVQDAQKKIDDQKKLILEREEALADAQEDLADTREQASELTVKAPFAGKLTEVTRVKVGDELGMGTTLATITDDSKMRLSLYISYAYEKEVSVGQEAQVSVPELMFMTMGKVEEIHKVNFIAPEGGTFFEVVVVLSNPETLTEGMEASAIMIAPSGTAIYPYDAGKLEFYRVETIATKQSGKVTKVGNLYNYADVASGEVLVRQSAEELNDTIESKEKAVEQAQQDLTEAQDALPELEDQLAQAQQMLEDPYITAPISGRVMSCSIIPGQEITGENTTVITISDTTNMTVEITVDDRNIPYVKPGMTVTLSDWNGMEYMGTVSNIDMSMSEGGSMGMTSYPVTLTVDNFDGSLMPGMWLTYSFVTSESVDCVTVPIECVKSIVDVEGNPWTVVFLKSDTRPDNAVDFEPPEEEYYYGGVQYPTSDEGFWPVPVETGLSDRYNIEIVSGIQAGDEVFKGYMMTGAYS